MLSPQKYNLDMSRLWSLEFRDWGLPNMNSGKTAFTGQGLGCQQESKDLRDN